MSEKSPIKIIDVFRFLAEGTSEPERGNILNAINKIENELQERPEEPKALWKILKISANGYDLNTDGWFKEEAKSALEWVKENFPESGLRNAYTNDYRCELLDWIDKQIDLCK